MLRRARRLLWLTLLPVLLLTLLMAAWQAVTQWHQVLETAASGARAQQYAFDGVARDADHHVADLRRWMEQEFLHASGQPDPGIADALLARMARDGRLDGYTLDALPELLRGGMGQLLVTQREDGAAPQAALLRRAQTLSSIVEVAHQRNSNFVWSYFFGWPERDVVVFPWVPSAAIAEEQGRKDLAAALTAWYGHEVVQGSMSAKNPAQLPYWTEPFAEAGGQGLLVSHAAPVVVGEELRGIVGTDVRLSTLETLLERLPGAPWQAWVVDDRGHVLADRQQPMSAAVGGARAASAAGPGAVLVPTLAQRLPAVFDSNTLGRAVVAAQQPLSVEGWRLVALGVVGTPWTVVLAASDHALLLSTLPQVLPYSLIAAALLVAWLLGQALLRQRVVAPLISIFAYLEQLSSRADTPEPQLGARWQPWVRTVTQIFAQLRRAAVGERRAEALKSAIVDHAQAAVVVADEHHRIVEFNDAAQILYGYPREQMLGKPTRELTPERYRAAYDIGAARMRQGDPDGLLGRSLQRVGQRADGSEFPIEVVIWLTRADGVAYFTGSITDQTATHAAAEVIARQREALRQSEKLTAMGSLLAGVAHELNNPLAIVMGRASLLEEKTIGSPLQGEARRIREAAERCGRIVKTFLNMARAKPAQRAPVPLNELARAAVDLLGYTLRSHGITTELLLGPALPEVMADPDQIGQVVLNLIINAQQALAAHAGPRRIAVSTGRSAGAPSEPRDCTEDLAAGEVWLQVSDSGPGVAATVREQIFDPFFTTKGEGTGTGLGLSVSRAILREHGGELTLMESAPGEGAAFRLSLPLRTTAPVLPKPTDTAHD